MEEQFTVRRVNGELKLTLSEEVYDEHQQDLARRSADGRYTLEEAALFISDATGERADELLRKLMDAAGSGALRVYEPGKDGRYRYGEGFASRVRHFYEEAYWDDLNKWLAENEPRIVVTFPSPKASTPVPDEVPEQTGTAHSGSTEKAAPAGISKREIVTVDWPLNGKFNQDSLITALSDVPGWLKPARTAPGSPGKASALWNPAILAVCLLDKSHASEKALCLFLRRHFVEWLPEWERLQAYR